MKIERKDFNIGQGGFSALKIINQNGNKVFSIVYDCGSVTSKVKLKKFDLKKELKDFNKDENIDLLVLSHLDRDHVNMAKFLFEGEFIVKNIVLPYVPDEAILLFLNSVSKNSDYENIKIITDIFRGKKVESRVFFNIDEEPNLTNDNKEKIGINEDQTPFFNSAKNPIDLEKDVLKTVIIPFGLSKNKRFLPSIQIIFFQPSYTKEHAQQLKINSSKIILKSCKNNPGFEEMIKNKKVKYKVIHTDLNKTCVGMCVTNCFDREMHIFTGDMTINKNSLHFLYKKLKMLYKQISIYESITKSYYRMCDYFFHNDEISSDAISKLKMCQFFNTIHFQLPHHGSLNSIDLKDKLCINLLKKSYVRVMHGKDRQKHPHPHLKNEIQKNGIVLNSITE